MSTLTATEISESAVITAYNRDTASHADLNTFTNAFKSNTDAIIVDLSTLNTDKLEADDDITFTGDNIFNGTVTLGSTLSVTGAVTLSSTVGITGNITFAGNLVSSGSSKTINFNTNKVQNIGAATTSTDAIQYQQAVKATGSVTENITGIKTFTTGLPICSTVPSSGSDLTNKTYVDLQVFGNSGITHSTSAPAATAGALWIKTTVSSNNEFFRGDGSVFVPISGIFQGTSAPTVPTAAGGRLWLDTTSTDQVSLKRYDGSTWKQCIPATIDGATTFTSAATFSTTTLTTGIATFTAVPVCSTQPTTSSQLANKGYVDSLANFNPMYVSGLTLWLKADSLTSLADGDPVTNWTDSTGSGEVFTEATNKPTYKTSIIGGKPVVRFDGVNDKLTSTSAISNFITNSAYTVFIVTRNPAAFNSGVTINSRANTDIIFSDSTSYNFAFYVFKDPGGTDGIYSLLNYDGTLDSSTDTQTSAVSTAGISKLEHNSGTISITAFGHLQVDVTSGNTSTLTGTLKLGTDGTNFGEIDIAEIIIYNVALSSINSARVMQYLSTKYTL